MDLIEKAASIIISRYPKKYKEQFPHIEKINKKEIISSLNYVKGNFEKFDIKITKSKIWYSKIERDLIQVSSVLPKEVNLGDIKLGKFQPSLTLDIGNGHLGWQCKVEALKPNPSKVKPFSIHPIISNNRICLGDAADPFVNAILVGDFGTCFDLIDIVLHNESDVPYIEIENWNGYKCGNCEKETLHLPYESCCNIVSCENCSISCAGCSFLHHDGCKLKCVKCGKDSCPSYNCFNKNSKRCRYCCYD